MEERLTVIAVGITLLCACGGQSSSDVEPEPTAPLPTAGIAGQEVTVYPLTLLAADETLGWQDFTTPRREALDRADSLIGAFLTERAPEVTWVLPDHLRRAASRAPGMLASPDQMGTALLRNRLKQIPDPLRSQMRTLNGVAGGRYAFVPASLVFYREPNGEGKAELTMVVVDVRTGVVNWRSAARGTAADPWSATWAALKSLVPGLP